MNPVPAPADLAEPIAWRALGALGECACVVEAGGGVVWASDSFQMLPELQRDQIGRAAHQSLRLRVAGGSAGSWHGVVLDTSRPLLLDVGERCLELRVAPFSSVAGGRPDRLVAVVWDATAQRRLQQRLDAINAAGAELTRLEGDAVRNLTPTERLKMLHEKIVRFSRDLLHFDHFTIRLLDRRTGKLECAISEGLPDAALDVDIYAEAEGNGISGYVAATGRSYICRDTEKDGRYIPGLSHSRSSLTVPLLADDRVVGIYNVESEKTSAFDEGDRQIAEIFGRYVASALSILDLLLVERSTTGNRVVESLYKEIEAPLQDTQAAADQLAANPADTDALRRLILAANAAHEALARAKAGPTAVLASKSLVPGQDPRLAGKKVLVADDDPAIRKAVQETLGGKGCVVVVAEDGQAACEELGRSAFDLVISDIRMPYRNGYEIFAAAQRSHSALPVILMTGFGYDPAHSVVRANQEGLAAVLFKPFSVDALVDEVVKALGV